ncbi:MAG: hypothetical protein ACYDAL_03185 [Candidatus Dormibacteraceae bacterium]
MIRRKIGQLAVASAFAFALTSAGVVAVGATVVPTPGSDLGNDVQASQASEETTANGGDTAGEVNVDDGQGDQLVEADHGAADSTSANS